MKPHKLLLLLLLPLAAIAFQNSSSPEDEVILQKEAALREAHLKGDAAALERLDADDFMAVSPDGVTRDKAWVLAAYKSGKNKDEAITNSEVKVRRYGNTAVVTMRTDIQRHLEGKDMSGAFRVTRVWIREHEDWRIAVTQSTRIASP